MGDQISEIQRKFDTMKNALDSMEQHYKSKISDLESHYNDKIQCLEESLMEKVNALEGMEKAQKKLLQEKISDTADSGKKQLAQIFAELSKKISE